MPGSVSDLNTWSDPRTIAAVVGTSVGLVGLLFGVLTHRWTRRESRLEALGKILQPLVRAAQSMMKAITARRMADQLKRSFPDPSKAPEVVERVKAAISDYDLLLKTAESDFRTAEAEFATRHFRFPDGVARSLNELKKIVGELGRLVNDGLLDKADIQLARFRDGYGVIAKTARGWRLADPFEWFAKRLRRPTGQEQARTDFDLSDDEMQTVMELLQKRVTSQAAHSFVVHPPRQLLIDPSILKSDDVIEQLKNSAFTVVFQDGTNKQLTLPQLIALTYNLIVYVQQTRELDTMFKAARPQGIKDVAIKYQFSMREIMQAEVVKELLAKIDFSDIATNA